MEPEQLSWPPAYEIRYSQRAKHVSLKISPWGKLEIIVPYRQRKMAISSILDEKKAWIQRNLSEIGPQTPLEAISLPIKLDLNALNQCWQITYHTTHKRPKIIVQPGLSLAVLSPTESETSIIYGLLQTWLRQQAKEYLTQRLCELSHQTQLIFQKVIIRGQLTRWGSCSSSGNIALNYKLLFLPPNLVDYILIHELCHTKHMNHSKRFWSLVAKHCQDWQKQRDEIRRAQCYIPRWIENFE